MEGLCFKDLSNEIKSVTFIERKKERRKERKTRNK